jgi:hypothetical protein
MPPAAKGASLNNFCGNVVLISADWVWSWVTSAVTATVWRTSPTFEFQGPAVFALISESSRLSQNKLLEAVAIHGHRIGTDIQVREDIKPLAGGDRCKLSVPSRLDGLSLFAPATIVAVWISYRT